jgi:lytic murein transglycosylase
MKKRILCLAVSVIATTNAACAQAPLAYVPPAFATSGSPEFDAWRTRFAYRAVQMEGKDARIVEATLAGLSPNPEVKRLNEAQPEFVRPIWDYIASAVSQARIEQGQALLTRHRTDLAPIAERAGVPVEFTIAIWGLESGYGANKGSSDVVRALASFAYSGRRTQLGESELLAVFDILARGEATRETLIGSWAGAMGHTQFMPSSFLAKAIDGDGDGKRDIWNSPRDALASTLNYLGQAGWVKGQPWGFEVQVPAGFDWSLADGTLRPISFWVGQNVVRRGGDLASAAVPEPQMRLLAPAGAQGSVFLVGRNFDAIRNYNASDAYALSVALLADQIAGRGAMPDRWPVANPPVRRSEAMEMQTLLNGMGFTVGVVDGQMGPKSRAALQAFQKAQGLTADGYPSQSALQSLRAATRAETPAPMAQ